MLFYPFAIVGANYGNSAGNAGSRCLNANNAASNANGNIGSRQSYQKRIRNISLPRGSPRRLAKINPIGQSLVALPKSSEEIRE